MTMSEFGRTPYSNDSAGTDHGTANVQFVIGPNVKGGHYGAAAVVRQHRPTSGTDSTMTTDFRHVLGTVIDGWMGGGASTLLNGRSRTSASSRPGRGIRRQAVGSRR